MSKPVISVENLSKAYRIGVKDEIPDTLVGAMTGVLRAPFKNFNRLSKLDTFSGSPDDDHSEDTLWALKDVSFDVQEGEVVGIIGRNGAGKSTLLKVLSRITEPTSGRVVIRGRVSSLLEVGTGFHPELTGRDNVYMNGTILGMTKREIDRKFDEIVEFSGVEKFLDTPVKRYSSGMQVRLAFAVAAHLEPEILIIDEVLAVGDAEFQKKCLGKMKDVAEGGRTVLFVSHNMAAVQNLCSRGIVFCDGQSNFDGDTREAVTFYLSSKTQSHEGNCLLDPHPSRRSGCIPILKSLRLLGADGREKDVFETGESLTIELSVNPVVPLRNPQFGIGFDSQLAGRIFSLATFLSDYPMEQITKPCVVRCVLPEIPLVSGRYYLSVSAGTTSERLLDAIDEAVHIDIISGDFYQNGVLPSASLGSFAVRSNWK